MFSLILKILKNTRKGKEKRGVIRKDLTQRRGGAEGAEDEIGGYSIRHHTKAQRHKDTKKNEK
jgi:hypothetical protein